MVKGRGRPEAADEGAEESDSIGARQRLRKRQCNAVPAAVHRKPRASPSGKRTKDPMVAFQRIKLPDKAIDFELPVLFRRYKVKPLDPSSEPSKEASRAIVPAAKKSNVRSQQPVYIHIKRNIYLCKKPRKKDDEGIECNCKGSTVCNAECICRMLYTSCSSNCGCGDGCLNLPFQKRKARKMKLTQTQNCGWGVVATENIKSGDFLIEYIGEVIDDRTCEERLWAMKARGECNFYLCEISRDVVIDATFKGNMSRFINHSCRPNAKLRKWQCDGEIRIGIFASRDIPVGREITYDYQYIQFGTEQRCHCGAANCSGLLGSKPLPKKKPRPSRQGAEDKLAMIPATCTIDKYFPQRKRTAPEPCVMEASVGSRVEIWWPLDKKYYSGSISHYNPVSGKHRINYDDGDVEEVHLEKEQWKFEHGTS